MEKPIGYFAFPLFYPFIKIGRIIALTSIESINQTTMTERIKTYREFYQFYLTEHSKTGTRIFHFIGTLLIFFVIGYVISSGKERFLWYIPIVGYGFAWFSHAVIERNKPATFKYPLWSLISDFKLFFELLIGKQKFITKTDSQPH